MEWGDKRTAAIGAESGLGKKPGTQCGRPLRKANSGVELCQILQRKSPRRLPVVLATAHTMSGDRERFLEPSGADGYLEKPVYDSTVLVEKARQLME